MLDLVFAVGSGLYLLGGLAIVVVFLAVDHVLFRRRVNAATAELRASSPRASRVFDWQAEVDDDWRGFPA